MNITEANAFHTLMRSVALEGDNTNEALEAAVYLTDRARKTLGAGPTGEQLRDLYQDLS